MEENQNTNYFNFKDSSEIRENSKSPEKQTKLLQITGCQPRRKSKNILEKKRIMGTPEYLAPEILKDGEISESVDWWQLGILAYELLLGSNPFTDEKVPNIFNKILSMKIDWPEIGNNEYMSETAYKFISQLLVEDPKQRLGFNGVQEIKQNEFFSQIDWEKIKKQEPAFKPSPSSEFDTQYFRKEKQRFSLSNINIGQSNISLNNEKKLIDFLKPEDEFSGRNIISLASINMEEARKALIFKSKKK